MYCLRLNKRKWSFASSLEEHSHSYDAANQLIRENLYYGAGNSNNATYTYTYDSWGNLTQRKKHTYTAPENQATMGTIYGAYGYTNSAWGDQLTSYNMQTISYDSMGNPISYLGATLSWNGKQLTGYSRGGTNVTYAYNEDGLRTQKTHNGTTTNYYYNGSVLIGMQSGNTVQRFSYDAQGKVVSVDYSENGGSTYTPYYYLRNAQGDIVKLIDNNKNTVVEYTYDSWGKLLATTGSLATSLGANQPFRYRGYVYDTETGWYYLQSRYYNPTTCRFISSDVLLSTGQGVIGHNSYAYCLNSPVNGHDSNGQAFRTNNLMVTDGGGGGNSVTYGGGAVSINVRGHKVNINVNICVIGSEKYNKSFAEAAIKKYYEGRWFNSNGDDYYDVSVNFNSPKLWQVLNGAVFIAIKDEGGTSYTHGAFLERCWPHNKSGLIVAYTHWSDGRLKDDLDWTIAHEFTHALNIGDQQSGEEAIFGSPQTIMNTRGKYMSYGVMSLIIQAFQTNSGRGW